MKPSFALRKPATEFYLPGLNPLAAAVERLADAGIEARGAIFTRREVVEFMLDLIGYTDNRPLHKARLLEPAFGQGDFLLVAVERLLASSKKAGARCEPQILRTCIRAVELHRGSFESVQLKLRTMLLQEGFSPKQADDLVSEWLIQGDFLLTEFERDFTHVIGNPPYVRQEMIPDVLIQEYRKRYETIYDRADLYVPFFERSLKLLQFHGLLSFICSDRWVKNKYGGPLRRLIAENFHVKHYVEMEGTQPFHSDVMAYPSIITVAHERAKATRIAHCKELNTLSFLGSELTRARTPGEHVQELSNFVSGDEPWLLKSSAQVDLVRRLEAEYPILEKAGCKVGIGVATGNDRIFIGKFDDLDVEPDRKLPLVTTRDILAGHVRWRGYGVLNPFSDDGSLVSLEKYPRLRKYLEGHEDQIRRRHVSQKNPGSWYRTIDRIYPKLAQRPKLLIPDIKGSAHIVFEAGELYPHHNLYFVTSDEWDLFALQAILKSGIARMFVGLYSTKMRGGYLRFQAQYLRRIRIPRWSSVPTTVRRDLIAAATKEGMSGCNDAVATLYKLSDAERTILGA